MQPPVILRYGHPRCGAAIIVTAVALLFCIDPSLSFSAFGWFVFVWLILIASMGFGETQVLLNGNRVLRVWRWLGLIPLRRREYSLADLNNVQLCHFSTMQGSYWHVGLIDRSGRFLRIQSFLSCSMGAPCRAANRYASQLSEFTGLPLMVDAANGA
jgi:hypothetical protein